MLHLAGCLENTRWGVRVNEYKLQQYAHLNTKLTQKGMIILLLFLF